MRAYVRYGGGPYILTHTPIHHPTTPPTREYALISGSDPLLKEDTRRVEALDPDLPRWIAALAAEGDYGDFIHVRVVRPSGPTYSVIDFPGAFVRWWVVGGKVGGTGRRC